MSEKLIIIGEILLCTPSVCLSVCPSVYFAMSYKNDCGVYYGVYHCVKSGGRTGNFSIPFLNLSCSLTELISVDYHGEVYSHQVNIQPGNVTLSCLGYFLENGVFGVREVSCKYNSNTETRCVYQDKTFKTY